MFRKILIANRGEIAVRVIRACRELGVPSVAVFSEADRVALHVQMADEAYPIGPPPARDSYLRIDRILESARRAGADAIHPGYGFLSENADFAEACVEAGVTFIGPSAQAIRRMGDKTVARETMAAAGVPVVPGDNGTDGRGFPDAAAALAAARRIGFPVILKAAAGGGGKGMRLLESEAKFESAFAGAQREAKAAFGDDAVYVERYLVRPRHVEIQIFGDAHGNTLHLLERDCSVQRRHQKVIEESPSPALDDDLRQRMGRVAVAAARAVDYQGAGTIEFLLSEEREFFFLEMNTRLQVEHPVTEMVTGLDLVRLQIEVAAGQPLRLRQEQIRHHGVAIECRVYAEDPVRFLPSPGKLSVLRAPGGPFVRDDTGVYEGSEISVYYDPLISKLIAWGEDRDSALGRMRRALSEYRIVGIKSNLAFHRRMLAHPAFLAGDYDTGFIDRHRADLASPLPDEETIWAALAAAALRAADDGSGTLSFGAQAAGDGQAATLGCWPQSARWRQARPLFSDRSGSGEQT